MNVQYIMNVQCYRTGIGTGTSDADTLWSNVRFCGCGNTTWMEEVEKEAIE